MKTCKKCLQNKDLSEFNRQKDTLDGLRTWCRICMQTYCKEWNAENATKTYVREKSLKERYGITQEDFDRMMSEQNGQCAICDREFPKIARVDHCHKTEIVRGLLCDRCNIVLAHYENLKDKPELVERLEKYLQKGRI